MFKCGNRFYFPGLNLDFGSYVCEEVRAKYRKLNGLVLVLEGGKRKCKQSFCNGNFRNYASFRGKDKTKTNSCTLNKFKLEKNINEKHKRNNFGIEINKEKEFSTLDFLNIIEKVSNLDEFDIDDKKKSFYKFILEKVFTKEAFESDKLPKRHVIHLNNNTYSKLQLVDIQDNLQVGILNTESFFYFLKFFGFQNQNLNLNNKKKFSCYYSIEWATIICIGCLLVNPLNKNLSFLNYLKKDNLNLLKNHFKNFNIILSNSNSNSNLEVPFPKSVYLEIKKNGYKISDLIKWIRSLYSSNCKLALALVENDNVPDFVLVHALRRTFQDKNSIYLLFKRFQKRFKYLPPQIQLFVHERMVSHCLSHFPELLIEQYQLFLNQGDAILQNEKIYNNGLIWNFLMKKSKRSFTSFKTIFQCINITFRHMQQNNIYISNHSFLAFAILIKNYQPQKSIEILNELYSKIDANTTKDFKKKLDVYRYLINREIENDNCSSNLKNQYSFSEIKTFFDASIAASPDLSTATVEFDNLVRHSTNHNSLLVPTILLLRKINTEPIKNRNEITFKIFKYYIEKNYPINITIIREICINLQSLETIKKIFSYAFEKNILLDRECLTNYVRLFAKVNLPLYINNLISQLSLSNRSVQIYNFLIARELQLKQYTKIWDSFQDLLNADLKPNVSTLRLLCMAASESKCGYWGDLHAAQRIIILFRKYVMSPPDNKNDKDLFKLVPSMKLWHDYIVFLGSAGYVDYIDEVVPWMIRLNQDPDNNVYCALIRWSSLGKNYERFAAHNNGALPSLEKFANYKTWWSKNKHNLSEFFIN